MKKVTRRGFFSALGLLGATAAAAKAADITDVLDLPIVPRGDDPFPVPRWPERPAIIRRVQTIGTMAVNIPNGPVDYNESLPDYSVTPYDWPLPERD